MNATVAHPHPLQHARFLLHGKSWFAAAAVLFLAALGFYSGISQWLEDHDIVLALLKFGTFAGPAVAYAFAFFWCFPGLLEDASLDLPVLQRRWSDFSLLTVFVALVVINLSYARVIWSLYSDVELWRAFVVLFFPAWFLAAAVVASHAYLGWYAPGEPVLQKTGWRAGVRRAMARFGGWLPAKVHGRGALAAGSAMILSSLLLDIKAGGGWLGGNIVGYRYLFPKQPVPPLPWAIDRPWPRVLVGQAHHLLYVLAIGIAALALLDALLPRAPRILSSRPFLSLVALLTLFEVADLASMGAVQTPALALLVLWLLACLVPAALWFSFVRGTPEHRQRVRLILMVYCLPIFLVGFAFLPINVYFALGHGALIGGLVLLWWGFLQERHDLLQASLP